MSASAKTLRAPQMTAEGVAAFNKMAVHLMAPREFPIVIGCPECTSRATHFCSRCGLGRCAAHASVYAGVIDCGNAGLITVARLRALGLNPFSEAPTSTQTIH